MININEKPYNWTEDMNIYALLKLMGYKLKKPAVLITINNTVIRRDKWGDFIVPENADISVLNLLRGG